MNVADFHMLHAKAHEHDFCHEPTEGERPHWQFRPGQSGNPAGRPKGSKNRGSTLGWALLDDKMAQYRNGAHFVRKVIREVGMDGFNKVWVEPAHLPSKAEIDDPKAWLRRVHG